MTNTYKKTTRTVWNTYNVYVNDRTFRENLATYKNAADCITRQMLKEDGYKNKYEITRVDIDGYEKTVYMSK